MEQIRPGPRQTVTQKQLFMALLALPWTLALADQVKAVCGLSDRVPTLSDWAPRFMACLVLCVCRERGGGGLSV